MVSWLRLSCLLCPIWFDDIHQVAVDRLIIKDGMKKFNLCLSAAIILIILCMSQIPIEAQSTNNPLSPTWMDWSNDGSRLVTVNQQGLTVYDSTFTSTNFRAFPSDVTYEVSPPHLSPDGTKILVNKEIWDASTLQTL